MSNNRLRFYCKQRRMCFVLILAVLPLISACSVLPHGFYYYGPELPRQQQPKLPMPVERLPVPKRFIAKPRHFHGFVAEGKAIVYADKHEGNLTSIGVSLKHSQFTAAHKSLPLGTKVRIIHLDSNRALIATIIDRMPETSQFLLTVTQAIARELRLRPQDQQNHIKIEVLA